MPAGVVRGYAATMEGLGYHNSLATGVGARHTRVLSIPQGCPFSMLSLDLVMTIWLRALNDQCQ
eukprot:3782210-Alexandrium_andersonii.AAC.1